MIDTKGEQTVQRTAVAAPDPALADIEGLLASFGIASETWREVVIDRMRQPRGRDGARPPASAEAEVRAWLASILGAGEAPELLAVGRAAWFACDGPRRWAGCFLAEAPPKAFVAEMRQAAPPLTPPERPGAMVEQRLDPWSPDLSSSTLIGRLLRPIVGGATAG